MMREAQDVSRAAGLYERIARHFGHGHIIACATKSRSGKPIAEVLCTTAACGAVIARFSATEPRFDTILAHCGRKHHIVCTSYGRGANHAVECETCWEVIVDEDC